MSQDFSDLEVAVFLMIQIENPATVEIRNANYNLRGFYLREAKRAIERMTDESAKRLLSDKIAEYEPHPLLRN